jgi:hydroxylysine kinase
VNKNATRGFEQLGALLDIVAPLVDVSEATALAREHFGLDVLSAQALDGERDRNFRLEDGSGKEFILKVVHPAERPDVTDLQSRVLLHIEKSDPDLQVPRVVMPVDTADCDIVWRQEGKPDRRIRCLTYLRGLPLRLSRRSATQRANLGAFLARLDLALRDFTHSADNHDLLWDLKSADRIRPLLAELRDPKLRECADRAMDRYTSTTSGLLPSLRRQVIHNDFNPNNVLIDPVCEERITGVIDFGDLIRSPMVQDLATAAAYQIELEGHPLRSLTDMAVAFHAVFPLSPEEIEVLPSLVATRLVLTVAISSWRADRQRENADYLLRNHDSCSANLQKLLQISAIDSVAWLRKSMEA